MSQATDFISKHTALVQAITAGYGSLAAVSSSENAMLLGTFPAIAVFLGIPQQSLQSRAFAVVKHSFVLGCFDLLDIDSSTDQLTKQKSTLELLVKIIEELELEVLTEIEPLTTIATGEGSFITGWTTIIHFNA